MSAPEMKKPIIKIGYVILDLRTTDVIVDRVFMNEEDAKAFIDRNPGYIMESVPVILEWVEG